MEDDGFKLQTPLATSYSAAESVASRGEEEELSSTLVRALQGCSHHIDCCMFKLICG
jgi:hypothetical protein